VGESPFAGWLSIAPFTTSWLGANPTAVVPTALYATVLFLTAIAYTLLQNALVAVNGRHIAFAKAVAIEIKGRISPALYICAIGFAFVSPIIWDVLILMVAAIWFIPDRRFEAVIARRT